VLRLRRRVRLLGPLIATVALASCGGTLVSDMDFHPPSKWVTMPSIGGREFWINPHDLYETVMIQRPGVPIAIDKPVIVGHSVISKSEGTTICGGHPAVLSHFRMSSRGHLSLVDMIETSWNSEVINALYARSIDKAPNATAERSIRSLCPKIK
jgi:hypothetical protein